MIKANELRAGSLLHYLTAEGDILPSKIDWQDLKWIQEDEKGFNAVHDPIVLTEQWLKDFGFEWNDKKESQWISVGEYELHITRNGFSGTLDKDPSWFCSIKTGYGSQPVTLIKSYVHEIQNLFYALTREELTLNK